MVVTLLKWVHNHVEIGELSFVEAAWNCGNSYPIWFFITHGRPFPIDPIVTNFVLHKQQRTTKNKAVVSNYIHTVCIYSGTSDKGLSE